MSEFGVRPAVGLLEYLDEHLDEAGQQLTTEAEGYRQRSRDWRARVGAVFANAPRRLDVTDESSRAMIAEGVKQAAGPAFWQAKIKVAERAQELITELRHQVISVLNDTLRQMANDLSSDAVADRSDPVSSWPGESGVPPAFVPPPFEACLLPHESWPKLLDELMAKSNDSRETMRAEVGGGGFTYSVGALDRVEPLALAFKPTRSWSPTVTGGSGILVEFDYSMSPNDVLARAQTWINRAGSALGDFLHQGLGDYLAPIQGGRPVPDHRKRLNDFEVQLGKTLRTPAPLVKIDPRQLRIAHPERADELLKLDLIPQKLPFAEGHPARDIAVEVLKDYLSRDGAVPSKEEIATYFADESSADQSVTYVSRLASAIHPVAITSLTQPIATTWNQTTRADTFWGNRRTRILQEFIPVPPQVLDAMIKGFFNARLLDLLPDPVPGEATGFSILSAKGEPLQFPWPLLAGRVPKDPSYQTAWLGWLLESLPLAMCLLPKDPEALDAYDRLYELGAAGDGAIVGFDELPAELKTAFRSGHDRSHTRVRFDFHGPDAPSQRRASCLAYLNRVKDHFSKQLHAPGELRIDDIWVKPPGYELFERIVVVLERQLIGAIENFDSRDGIL
jgi:hypothetical protein